MTAFGDVAVILPCAALIFLSLCASEHTRGLAWRWASLFLVVSGVVAASKLIFMGWGWGIQRLDFIGLSGHSAMAALIWPSVIGLLYGQASRRWRFVAVSGGFLMALLVAVSRLTLRVHSITEVVAGFVVGAAAALWFLLRYDTSRRLDRVRWLLGISILLVLPFVYGHRFPSEQVLRLVARHMSLDGSVHSRRYLRDVGE